MAEKKVFKTMASCGSTEADHSITDPKIKGSNISLSGAIAK
jgi:hypothetical protein